MTKPRPLTAIVAATLDNGIGREGGLPWRLPGEIKYFARVTTGEPSDGRNAVVMGRRTWDAHASFEDALASVPGDTHRVFLIGGATLYNAALPSHVDRVLLTRVLERLPCDVFLSDFTSLPGWRLTSHDELRKWVGWEVPEGEIEEKGIRYRYEMWVKE
ncbi:hypothetical protein CspHIS471_0404570 [Cutaneotrichosporon sp. HIS471]|nr:hypothetical protein CspHIS471_0404570 [Cutaneotrichosporon sp. HIS471]